MGCACDCKKSDARGDELPSLLDELAELTDRRTQLKLYCDLISRDEQKLTGEIEMLDAAVALLGAKIYAVREHLSADGEEPPADEVTKLDEISRQLAELAARRVK